MLELLVLVSGLVALYRFSKATRAVAEGAEVKTQVWAESVIADSTIERAQTYKDWQERSKDLPIISHERFMQEMRGQ